MKLLFLTYGYGNRVAVRLPIRSSSYFFEGTEPERNTIVVMDLPGLEEYTALAVRDYFEARLGPKGPRELLEIPESMWRTAVLDDFIDAEDVRSRVIWLLKKQFSLADFQQFAMRHLPLAQVHMTMALGIEDEEQRLAKLGEIQPFLQRVFGVLLQAPAQIKESYAEGMKKLEEARINEMGTFSVALWVKTADSLYTRDLSLRLLIDVVKHFKATGASQEQFQAFLTQVNESPKLRSLTDYTSHFWVALSNIYIFEGNVVGETIDVAAAKEQTVRGSWQLFEARRVGRIIPGRAALVLQHEDGTSTYIGADRKLKFEVNWAGGRLERLGNTLIIGDSDEARLHRALVVVEELNALANVDPQEAVRRVEHLNLPSEHLVYEVARKAAGDARYGRILSDLLIELVVGIDADVAHRLIRAQSRKRR